MGKKKRLIVKTDQSWVNIPCDNIMSDEHYLYGYKDGELVAIVMKGTFDSAWISEEKES